ncbi:aldo/keto reductase [bacterium SM23_57]|jgi:predicted aldo/keto reductase-like oxidoreductase|nr:MAG: aldo/keto reductase [bacterium SM23_57]
MQYRKFGKLEWKVSALGFGAMRLPILDNDSSKINEELASSMLRYAIDHGVNYIDTAYPYHGGQSEIFVGKILKEGYRNKVKLATKLPCWLIKKTDDFDIYFNEQLDKLQTDYIDFYLLHALNKNRWTELQQHGVVAWAEKTIKSGKIKYLGFSFHDDFAAFKYILDSYDRWTFAQIQYNYMDIKNQAGTRGLRYAASKGLAVVIMEPILGGRLVDPPSPILDVWETAENKRTPADWALQWLWDQPEVSVVLSGMSQMSHVTENVASANMSGVCHLEESDLDLIDAVREKYNAISPIPCTKCDYCMPCPNGVNIPRNFEIYNQGIMYDKIDDARKAYNNWFAEEERAYNCIECLECEEKCPQKIPIAEWLPKVNEILSIPA